MIENCLLIKTKDHRRFLTYLKNLASLIEFAKIFGAEIFLVEPTHKQKVLELKTLTAALCNPDLAPEPQYRKIEKIFPKPKRDRKTILAESEKIRNYIRKQFLAEKTLSLKTLKLKYKNYDLTDACLCNHLSIVRKELMRSGHQFDKLGAGTYCLSKS